MNNVEKNREKLKEKFFTDGLPRLWCPPLTHYKENGEIDKERMRMHFEYMKPYVNCFLVPGSTGDGWEMNDAEVKELLNFLLSEAKKHKFWIMIGALKTEKGETLQFIQKMVKEFVGENPTLDDFIQQRICGFAVTPPQGKNVSQEEIYKEFEPIFDTGYPLALYQLPQITENEFSPRTFNKICDKYSNLYLMKDTSGNDRVVLSEFEARGVFMVRGMEGDYSEWIEPEGPYDGLLLSTANCFARELTEIIKQLEKGELNKAHKLSKTLTKAMDEIFEIVVENLSFSNRFTNANKVIDHHLAYGENALKVSLPRSYGGNKFPEKVIQEIGLILDKYNFSVEKGYLEE